MVPVLVVPVLVVLALVALSLADRATPVAAKAVVPGKPSRKQSWFLRQLCRQRQSLSVFLTRNNDRDLALCARPFTTLRNKLTQFAFLTRNR